MIRDPTCWVYKVWGSGTSESDAQILPFVYHMENAERTVWRSYSAEKDTWDARWNGIRPIARWWLPSGKKLTQKLSKLTLGCWSKPLHGYVAAKNVPCRASQDERTNREIVPDPVPGGSARTAPLVYQD
jgi:hypothetical protein